MSVHDIPNTRARAAAILSGRKLQMLEEAGMMVVPIALLKRMDLALQLAPWPSAIDNDLYAGWYEITLSPVWSDVSGELREVIEAREGFLSKRKVYRILEETKDESTMRGRIKNISLETFRSYLKKRGWKHGETCTDKENEVWIKDHFFYQSVINIPPKNELESLLEWLANNEKRPLVDLIEEIERMGHEQIDRDLKIQEIRGKYSHIDIHHEDREGSEDNGPTRTD